MNLLDSYSGPAEVVHTFDHGRVQIIHFHGETIRGWGYDLYVSGERIGPGMNTEWMALSVARNYYIPAEQPEEN